MRLQVESEDNRQAKKTFCLEHSTHFSKYTIFCDAIFLNFKFFKKMFILFVLFLKQNSVCAKSEKITT